MPAITILLIVFSAGLLSAERMECRAIADSWIATPPWGVPRSKAEAALRNHGRDVELHVRGREAFALLMFDVSAAKGIMVERATLRVHRREAPIPLHTVGLSTISGSGLWSEGSVNYYQPREDEHWSYAGSDIADVTFAQGGSLYAYERPAAWNDGWWEINVSPVIVNALITGDQFGVLLTDEKGQAPWEHVFDSRESTHPPVLIVEGPRGHLGYPGPVRSFKSGGAILDSTPAEVRALGRTTLRPGSVVLDFGGAGHDDGAGIAAHYEVRYSGQPIGPMNFDAAERVPRWCLNPLAPKSHPLDVANTIRDRVSAVVEGLKPGALYYFAARAMDGAGNSGPASTLGRYRAYARANPKLPAPALRSREGRPAGLRPLVWAFPELLKLDPRTGALLEQAESPDHRAHNSVWDAASRTVRLAGARNEFVAFQLVVESSAPLSGVEVKVTKPLFSGARLPAVFRSTGAVQLYREWFVPDDKDTSATRPWYPDALVPLAAPFDLPSKDNPVSGQTVQPLFVDVYVPRDARPGRHAGELLVKAAGADHRVAVEVDVLPLALPDTLSFIVDLNCYSGVDSGWNLQRGTPPYRKLEQAYHRAAHLHRANLDVLGYSHNGTTVPDHAPPLDGEGAATTIASWADWDAHFGPLLDGSAFSDLPRAGVPIPAMYLPFFENWPGDLRRSYKHNDYPVAKTEEEYRAFIARHGLEAGPIEESFTPEYQDRYSAVVAQFAGHLEQRGWTKTNYFVYFNNKYYYKRPAQGGRGVSWWLLDEPNHRDDVRAISFLAWLTRRGLEKHPGAPIILRTDISRVDWIRDLLAGQIDLNCVSRRLYEKNRYLLDDRRRFGSSFWNYASTNHPRETNVAMRAWCWKAWLHGADGIVPWNAVRGAESWERAEPLTVFYPAAKFGRDEPFVSMRLKAFRRGQQDIEYLALLAKRKGWDRETIAAAVSDALDLSSESVTEWDEDAGIIRFRNVRDAQLDDVRLRVARLISGSLSVP
jgi:hypothetical protein